MAKTTGPDPGLLSSPISDPVLSPEFA